MIVHLGLGAFHRAHQAVYTQDAGAWEICGVAHRSHETVDALRASDYRYTVVAGEEAREITCITEALVDDPATVVKRIKSADIVTLTITEAGYARGNPLLELLARGLHPGLTVISCDNLARNGERLRDLLGGPANYPCTVVDRIVPKPEDPLTVITEPYSQWVIEHFEGPRPDWDAEFVADTRPYEQLKLRLLNGSHSALAHLGLPKGHTTVAEAIDDPELNAFVRELIETELLPSLDFVPDGYVETMLTRFANPDIEHRLEQIATGAEHKLPQRLLPARTPNTPLIDRVIAAAVAAPTTSTAAARLRAPARAPSA